MQVWFVSIKKLPQKKDGRFGYGYHHDDDDLEATKSGSLGDL